MSLRDLRPTDRLTTAGYVDEYPSGKHDLEFQVASCRRELLDERTRAALLEEAIRHILRRGKIGKQSEARLRAAVKAVEVSRG